MGIPEFVAKLDITIGGLCTLLQFASEVGEVLWAEPLTLWGLMTIQELSIRVELLDIVRELESWLILEKTTHLVSKKNPPNIHYTINYQIKSTKVSKDKMITELTSLI